MTCCHCGGDVVAERTGDGLRVPFGLEPSFVLATRCPHPRCGRVVCARQDLLDLTPAAELLAWSPRALISAASGWLWLSGLVVAFATIPAIGLSEALDSLLCGGVSWLFFVAGSLLALVPVIYFVRALACGANQAIRNAARVRATIRAGATGGLRLTADPRTYRSH